MTLLPRLIVYPPLLFAPYACWPSGRLPFSLEGEILTLPYRR
jgi:hypothetical protein